MIILKCSKCREQLEVDDAFAGGVCRCVHCGALSHVPVMPTRLDRKGRPTAPPEMARPVIATPQEQERLVIAPARQYVAMQKRRGLLAILMMLAALGMAAGFAVLAWRLFGPQPPSTSGQAGTREETNLFAATGPNFAGLDLSSGPVAYLIDSGGSMRDCLDGVARAVDLSARTLGDAKFAVLVWPQEAFMGEPHGSLQAFPDSDLAGPSDHGRLPGWLDGLSAGGRRDPGPAIDAAMARGARTLLLLTASDLDADQARSARTRLDGKGVRVLAAAIGSSAEDFPELTKLAGQGHLRVITLEELAVELPKAMQSSGQAPAP